MNRLVWFPCLGALVIAACSPSTSTQGSSGASGTANAGVSANVSEACGRLFDGLEKATGLCEEAEPRNAAQLSQAKTNFLKSCASTATAPGSGVTTAYLDACAKALSAASTCGGIRGLEACKTPRGTLANGGGCLKDTQCASGKCGSDDSGPPFSDAGAPASGKPDYCKACVPTLAEGAACGTASSDACAGELACIAGKCTNITMPVADGQSCALREGSSTVNLSCNEGSTCEFTAAPSGTIGTCKKAPVKGEACTNECVRGLLCVASKCADPVPEGGDCPFDNSCNTRLFCNASKKCEKRSISSVDGPCGTERATCGPGLSCTFGGGKGTCKAEIPEGAACIQVTDGSQASCERSLACVRGTCQFEDANLCK
jgi:hypothetical protein